MTISSGTDRTYSVGEASSAVGLSTYTLRWYEQEGLVEPVERDSAGRRRYHEKDLTWLDLVTKLRRTGMSVADMRRYADLVRSGPSTVDARRDLLEAHRVQVEARIAALQADLEVVKYKLSTYH